MTVHCYSQRILNPFRGVMNVISIGGADAVTIDGFNWTLYIHDTFDCPTDDPEEFFEIEMPDIRFGDWNKSSGLSRSPLISSYHYSEIQAIGSALIDALQQYADGCPFQFDDNYELWLLDSNTHKPLALLASVCHKDEIYTPENLAWEAGIRCKQEFLIEFSLTDKQLNSAGELLNQMVNRRAGDNPGAQWFYRDQSGYGRGIASINLDPRFDDRELSARLFPKLLVQRQWQHQTDSSLIDAFVNWLSPYLLVLDFIQDKQREQLESAAKHNALLVEKMFLLYPKIINQQAINAARVEARMRKTLPESTVKPDFAVDTV
jgi:hypothetical protein